MSDATKQLSVEEYRKRADKILTQMMQVLMKAQRKVDDAKYRKALEKLQK